MSSKFLTESTGEKIVKIGQYLAKLMDEVRELTFLGHPVGLIIIMSRQERGRGRKKKGTRRGMEG